MNRRYARLGLLVLLSFGALAALMLLKPGNALATPPYYARGDFNSWGTTDQLYDDGSHGDVTSGDGIYTTIVTPTTAGRYEWKAADAGWTESWPSSNAWLVTSADNQPVLVTFDTNLHTDGWVPSQYIVNAADGLTTWTAVGDWQGWNNGNAATAMTAVSSGLYRFATVIPSAGTHQFKATRTGVWDAVGQDGPGGGRSINTGNLDFTTEVDNEYVVFWLNANTGRIKVQSYGALVINELDSDTPGTDAAEFVELYDGGVGNTPLDGLVMVFYNGSNDLSYAAYDLDGYTTNADGYFLLGNAGVIPTPSIIFAGNFLQNGQDAAALYLGDAASFPNNTAVVTTNIVDALVYDTADADDPGLLVLLNAGQPQIDENTGNSSATLSNQRCPNGTGGARNTTTYTQQLPTAGTLNCPPALTITKDAPALVGVGDVIDYTIWVTNTGAGSLATGLVITDAVPVSTTYAYGGSYAGGVVTFVPGTTLGNGQSISVTFGVTVTANFGDVVTNDSYGVSANELTAPVMGAPVNTAVSALDLVVTKSGPAVGFTEDNLVYTIHIGNVGVAAATTVIVTDTLPVSTTFVSVESTALTTTLAGGQVILEMGDLPADTLETIVMTVTVDADVPSYTILTNSVTATTLTPGDNEANNTDTWNTTIYQIIPISAARAGTDGQVFAVRGQVVYTPGTFNGSGWALQDASGGIGVFYNPPPSVARDDTVLLMATRGSFSGEEQFVAPVLLYANEGQGSPVTPTDYTTSDVAAGLSEGWLVHIEGVLSDLTTCTGNYDFLIDDGSGPATVFIDQDTGVNLCNQGAQNGDTVLVTGYSTQFNATYEVKPRDVNDVILIQDVPVLTKDAPAQVLPGELFTYTLSLQNFTGNTLTGVVITDVVPVNGTFAYALDGGTEMGGVVSWSVGNVPDHTNLTVQFAVTATLNAPAFVDNTDYAVEATNYPTPTFGTPVSTLVLDVIGPNCGDPAVPIHGIQGSGSISPIIGTEVTIEGVVVGDYQIASSGYDGFFVQEEDGDADGNPMTSEGIFIFNDTLPVQLGDVVRIVGTVAEFSGLTELNSVADADIQICNTGASVTPASVTLPVADLDEWEWYEGMLLTIPHPLYVTEIFDLGRYGEVSLSVNDRLDTPTQVTDPGANAIALQDLNNRSRIQLNDGQSGQNPDPIIYPTPELSATNTLRGGDMLTSLTGVLNYSFGAYLVEPVGPIDFVHSNPRVSEPEPLTGTLKIVSFNVLNYFSTIDDGVNDICGPLGNQECRGADSAEEFTRQRDKIINALIAIDPDVAGLIEIENNADDEALDDLISGLNAIAGAGTYAKISTGTIGSDAIKVALIYKPASVSPFGDFAVLDDSFDPGYHDDYNRPALAQTFTELASGEKFTVVVNHFKSKGSACDAIGDPDTGDGQGNCNLTRTAAAEILVEWLATDPTDASDPDYLLLGDLNSYAMEDPIAALGEGSFTNLHTLTGEDYYSYAFDGQWGTLDYALANNALLAQIAGVTTWHINSDEPIILDYNTEFKSTHHIQSLYTPEPYRASDHDPIIVSLNLVPLAATFTSNSPVTIGDLSVFTSTVSQEGVDYAWEFGDGGTSTLANPTHTYASTGTYSVTLTVSLGSNVVVVTGEHVVNPVIVPPLEADFTSNSPVTLGELAVFTSTANQDGVTYVWTFGDGGTSTLANPVHAYEFAGTYDVILEVSNGDETVTVTGTFEVLPQPVEEYNIFLPIIVGSADSAATPAPQAKLPTLGMFFAVVGLGGSLTLRRKK